MYIEGGAASMAAADIGDMGEEGGWGDSDLVLDEGISILTLKFSLSNFFLIKKKAVCTINNMYSCYQFCLIKKGDVFLNFITLNVQYFFRRWLR